MERNRVNLHLIWFLYTIMLSVPGCLYAICRVHHDSDELSEWRTRSHACCEIEKAEVVWFISSTK